jgi:hypothetical protein
MIKLSIYGLIRIGFEGSTRAGMVGVFILIVGACRPCSAFCHALIDSDLKAAPRLLQCGKHRDYFARSRGRFDVPSFTTSVR